MQLVQIEHEVVVGVAVEIDDLEIQHCQTQHAFEVVHNVEASLLSNEANAKHRIQHKQVLHLRSKQASLK